MISLSRLKEMVEEEMENKIKDLEQQLKRKEQECEGLKEVVKKQKDVLIHKTILADKLSKTLTEIKEIVEQGVKIHDDIIVSKQILQKISECGIE